MGRKLPALPVLGQEQYGLGRTDRKTQRPEARNCHSNNRTRHFSWTLSNRRILPALRQCKMFWLRMIDYIFNSLFSENCRSQMGNARAGWPAWGMPPAPKKHSSDCVPWVTPKSARQGDGAEWTVYQTVYHGLRKLRLGSASAIFGQRESPLI